MRKKITRIIVVSGENKKPLAYVYREDKECYLSTYLSIYQLTSRQAIRLQIFLNMQHNTKPILVVKKNKIEIYYDFYHDWRYIK